MSTYPGKRAFWLMALLWGCTIFFAYLTFTVGNEPAAPWMQVFATVFFAVQTIIIGAVTILAYYTYYILDPEALTVKVGPFSKKIALGEITEAFPTHNPISSAAWSLDRIHVRFVSSRFGVLIAPVQKEKFLRELAGLASHLELRGNRVVGRESNS